MNHPEDENSPESLEQKKLTMINKLGSLLHDEWRAPRKKEDGTFEPRLKKTKDQAWSKKNGTDEVDIANTSYENLPEDWKGENKISAEVAINEVLGAIQKGQKLDDQFIESASDVMHVKWLERNGSWAPAEQKKPYQDLSDEEKEKDRVIIRKAIEIYKESLKEKYGDVEKLQKQAVGSFREILSQILMARDFNSIKMGLQNADKGYSFSREGRTPGFREMDPFCLRGKIQEVGASYGLVAVFDDLMIKLSETDSIPWEDLNKTLDEVVEIKGIKM